MNAAQHARRNDLVGLAALAGLLLLSWLFRTSPDTFLAPGYPILREAEWPASAIITSAFEEPVRRTNIYDFNVVAYSLDFWLYDETQQFTDSFTPDELRPTSFGGRQDLTWFADSASAVAELQQTHTTYVDGLHTGFILIAEIPGLSFTSRADQYYLECEQVARVGTAFSSEHTEGCKYWAVYGHYYTRVGLSMWPISGGGRIFSTELLSELLNRVDSKLWEASH